MQYMKNAAHHKQQSNSPRRSGNCAATAVEAQCCRYLQVDVLEYFEDMSVHSARAQHLIPAVCRVRFYVKVRASSSRWRHVSLPAHWCELYCHHSISAGQSISTMLAQVFQRRLVQYVMWWAQRNWRGAHLSLSRRNVMLRDRFCCQ